MTQLTANIRPIDRARAERLTLAWKVGDDAAFHAAMTEVMTDQQPAALPCALFAAISLAVTFGDAALTGELQDVLRAGILEHVKQQDAVDARAAGRLTTRG